MARIEDLNSYELAFRVAMMTRGYKSAIASDGNGYARGVLLTHPDKTFRFRVEGLRFDIETPKIEGRGYGVRRKEVTKWYSLRNVFTQDEHKHYQTNSLIPDMDDSWLLARVAETVEANDQEESMRGVRQARRTALREAAPAMWRALSLLTSDKIDRELLEDADPKALKQCLEALEEAGEQDPNDLSVSRYAHKGA